MEYLHICTLVNTSRSECMEKGSVKPTWWNLETGQNVHDPNSQVAILQGLTSDRILFNMGKLLGLNTGDHKGEVTLLVR